MIELDKMIKIPVLWDMETGDPDDFLVLCWLLDHPRIDLKAVTVVPGTREQCALVLWAIDEFGRCDVEVGAFNLNHDKDCVNEWHGNRFDYKPKLAEVDARAQNGPDLLARWVNRLPELTILTGGPLRNLGEALRRNPGLQVHRLVAQGGYAGANMVPDAKLLPHFKGKNRIATWNLNGSVPDAKLVLESERIARRLFCSKNVCHLAVNDRPPPKDARRGVAMLRQARASKKLHDFVAAVTVLDETICTFAEVELTRHQGAWGSVPATGTRTFISVDIDLERFYTELHQ